MCEQRRHATDRAGLALDIVEREIAFGRRVEFKHLRNPKTRLKIPPYVAPQAVAAGEPQPMRAIKFGRCGLDKITAELADILKQRAVEAHDVAPEMSGREFLDEHGRSART